MIDDYKSNIESVLLSYYIRYTNLQSMTYDTLVNSRFADSNTITIYVDLYDMLNKLYSTNIYTTNKFAIVSSVINLAGHLREFYYKNFNVNTLIYLVYADETCPNHRQFYSSFGNNSAKETRYYDKIYNIINSQLDMIKILVAYIPGVYLVRKTCNFGIFVYDQISKNNNMIPAIILTKSKYCYQLPALKDNAIIFRPKKVNGDDDSFAIINSNVLFKYNNKINSQTTLDKLKTLNPKLLSLLMTLTGVPEKKVTTMTNITTAVGRLYKAINENNIINDYNSDMQYVYNKLQLFNIIDINNFSYRFNAIDLVFQHQIYCTMPECNDYSWLIDLRDINTLYDISNKYFIDNPLYLDLLL